ncbi:MAG: HD domain-containing protein [Candidatus Latescibacteria bacterium]|nr:HD domain-containing protein [Candidatus Latescibacterota bacterium]
MHIEQSQHIAVIDLGSNTARVVVMHAVPGYAYRLVDEIRQVVRLRQGLTSKGLSPEAIQRAFSTLRLFKRFCDSTGVNTIIATATSAVREAANGPAFIARVQRQIGLSLRILDGEREAYYGVLGALNDVPLKQGVILDIGGGSAQLSLVRQGRFERGQALTLGALALTEGFVSSDPIGSRELSALKKEIDRQLDTVPWLKKAAGSSLVGLGGSIRNLALIEARRRKHPLYTMHGFELRRNTLARTIGLLQAMPLAKRQKIPGLSSDRADIILPGALVLERIMERLEATKLTVSTSGLREGLFLEQFWHHLPYPVIADVRRFGVLNIARIYQYHKPHANHVRYLAGRLFDQLAPLHQYGPSERQLLEAAALLHDLGTIIGYDDHHKHSQTLIEYNGLPGFSPRQIALIALLTRYHRKGKPEVGPFKSLLRKHDDRLLLCLAALLRLAEFLERGRNAAVDDVGIDWTDEQIHITLVADEYPTVELWESQRHARPLFEEVFGRSVHLDSLAAPNV